MGFSKNKPAVKPPVLGPYVWKEASNIEKAQDMCNEMYNMGYELHSQSASSWHRGLSYIHLVFKRKDL